MFDKVSSVAFKAYKYKNKILKEII